MGMRDICAGMSGNIGKLRDMLAEGRPARTSVRPAVPSGNVERLRDMLAEGQSVKPSGRVSPAVATAPGLVMWLGGMAVAAMGGLSVGAVISRFVYADPAPVFAASFGSDVQDEVPEGVPDVGSLEQVPVPVPEAAPEAYGPWPAYGPAFEPGSGLGMDGTEDVVAVPAQASVSVGFGAVASETKYVPDIVPDPVPESDEPPEPVLPENEMVLSR